jgi:hypothetical protein
MIFKRKSKEKKSLCFHEWCLVDFGIHVDSDGVRTDFDEYYVLGCEKCGSSKKVDELVFEKMKRTGLIKEER